MILLVRRLASSRSRFALYLSKYFALNFVASTPFILTTETERPVTQSRGRACLLVICQYTKDDASAAPSVFLALFLAADPADRGHREWWPVGSHKRLLVHSLSMSFALSLPLYD